MTRARLGIAFGVAAVLSGAPLSSAAQSSTARFLTGDCERRGTPPDLASVIAVPDSQPRFLGPNPRPPKFTLRDGYRGRVVIAAVVDSGGLAEPSSAAIVESTDPELSRWACQNVDKWRFAPAWMSGRLVRAQVVVPFHFSSTVRRRDGSS